MKIQIKHMVINHFKGIRTLEVRFDQITNIYGDNATGKTTVMDAFLWLLFGKDSTDRTQFEVKHISTNGNGSPKDVEVEGVLLVDDSPVHLKRVLREKWVKRRGSIELEFAGHETTCFYNEVPVSLKEYQEKVFSLCQEDAFKMLTNPYLFNSLKWNVQRDILFEIAGGDLPDATIAKGKPEFEQLLSELTNKTIEEYKKQVAAQRRRIKDELDLLPARIDEVSRQLPAELNWIEVEKELQQKQAELHAIEEAITNKSAGYEKAYQEKAQLQEKLHHLQSELSSKVALYNQDFDKQRWEKQQLNKQIARRIGHAEEEIKDAQQQAVHLEEKVKRYDEQLVALRNKYHELQQERFEATVDNTVCPTCKRPLEDAQERLKELQREFNRNKVAKLELIQKEGRDIKQQQEAVQLKVQSAYSRIKSLRETLHELNVQLKTTQNHTIQQGNLDEIPGYKELAEEIEKLKAQYDQPVITPDLDQLKHQKAEVVLTIQQLSETLSVKQQISKGKQRIVELEDQQAKLAQEVARLEKIEFTIQRFERAKSDAIERKVNAMFKITRWKLFETQVNGQEIPTCKAMYKGVPYSDLNSAAKANVGVDIINTLSQHYGLTAPIFIDNREGVNRLIETPSQLVNLIVTKDPQLIIKTLHKHGTEHIAEQAQAY